MTRLANDFPPDLPPAPGRWLTQAACAGLADDKMYNWFPEPLDPPTTGDMARAICRSCPVRLDCAEYGLVNRLPWGIWGGVTEQERGFYHQPDHILDRKRNERRTTTPKPALRKPKCPGCFNDDTVISRGSQLTCVDCQVSWPAPAT